MLFDLFVLKFQDRIDYMFRCSQSNILIIFIKHIENEKKINALTSESTKKKICFAS